MGPVGLGRVFHPVLFYFIIVHMREGEKGRGEGVREGETGRWGGGRENTQAGAHVVAFTCGIILLAFVSPIFE